MFAIASPTESICLGLTINHGGVIWRVKATNENTAAAKKAAEKALISVCNLGRFVKCLSRFFVLFVFISTRRSFCGNVFKSEESSSCNVKGRNYWSVTYSFNCVARFQAYAMLYKWIDGWTITKRMPPFKKCFSNVFFPKPDIRNFIVTRKFWQRVSCQSKHSRCCEYFISPETLQKLCNLWFLSFHSWCFKNAKLKVALAYIQCSHKRFSYLRGTDSKFQTGYELPCVFFSPCLAQHQQIFFEHQSQIFWAPEIFF